MSLWVLAVLKRFQRASVPEARGPMPRRLDGGQRGDSSPATPHCTGRRATRFAECEVLPELVRERRGRSRRRGQHERIFEFHDLAHAFRVHDLHADEFVAAVIDIDFLRLPDQVIDAVERDFDNIVLGIVGNSKEWQPFRGHLITELERQHFDLRSFAL